MSLSLRHAPSVFLVALVVWLGPAAGCAEPCVELEVKVCEELRDKRRCEIMQDVDRRELLGKEACAGILEHLDRR